MKALDGGRVVNCRQCDRRNQAAVASEAIADWTAPVLWARFRLTLWSVGGGTVRKPQWSLGTACGERAGTQRGDLASVGGDGAGPGLNRAADRPGEDPSVWPSG